MRFCTVTVILFFTSWVWAQNSIRVEKVKGRRAIVVLPEDYPTKKGDVLYISEDPPGPSAEKIEAAGDLHPRNQKLGIELEFSDENSKNEDTDAESDTKTLGLNLLWGFNRSLFEFGPLLSYESSDSDSAKSSLMGAGGYLEYNFKPNQPGQRFIPGLGLQGEYAFGTSEVVAGSEVDVSITSFQVYAYFKMFPWSGGVAIEPKVFYEMETLEQSIVGGTTKTENKGFGIRIGLSTYIEDLLKW